MFSTIFKQELKYWFKKPSFYVYSILFFLISTFISAAIAGFFDFLTVSTGSAEIINSPTGIYGVFGAMEYLIFFFLPSIIGISTYRDFKSNIHSILFSYPFSKADYLLAKFFSSTLIVSIIMVVVSIGMFVGFRLPGTNPDIVTSFNLIAYLQTYFISILPNLLLLGSIVFSVVTFTRNISAGFITVIVFIFLQVALSSILNDPAQDYLLGLLDPFGSESFHYYTKNWTVAERNEFLLPIESLVIINRMLWLAIATIIFILTYRKFSFNQSAYILKLKKAKEERVTKQNFGGTKKITLPKVKYNFTFKQRLIATWRISKMEYKYIVKSWPFISILLLGLIFLFLSTFTMGEIFGTAIRPTTWQMLSVPAGSFFLFINILTFLYSGMLVHRSRMNNVNHLVDATPIPNWSLMASKIIAVIRMQILLLFIIMVSGIVFQIVKGYYNFEIGHYIFELFGLRLLHFMIWAMLAVFIQTLIRNPFLGLFILLLFSMALPFLSFAGIEQSIFKYNSTPGFNYSDMNGYGSDLPIYITHKIYWLCNGIIFLFLSSLFWVRGFTASFKERISVAKSRISKPILAGIIIFGLGFISLGYKIYYANNILVERLSSKESEELQVDWEKKYKQYEGKAQPRITDVKTKVDLFPKTKDFKASGTYTMINKTNEPISELYLNHNSYPSTFKFSKPNVLTIEDTAQNFDIYTLNTPLLPGEEMTLEFTVKNHENHPLKKRSPVKENGTFINNFVLFPSFGYSSQGELTDNKVREKYGLGKNDLKPHPSDTTALGNTYISGDADWINFEATVSTSEDQIAIAPGTKIREWKENGRNYYTYKMDNKILNFYAFNSGRYEIHTDKWKDVDIEIYYHKGHNYNLNYFVDGVKASLDYNSKNFSPYQHKVVRIVEFPRTDGSFAQSFPNTIPYSEGVGFIADIDTTEEGGVDYAFAITVHELAHQWWAHQVIGADVLGSTMMSESLSEYVSLQVLKHHHGESKMRKFLKRSLDEYLVTRSTERKRENALMYNDGQGYIHYQKGSLVFYALSDYIGEDILNNTLKKYVENVKFQEPPYTTSIEMVDALKEVTPDSLQYVIKDMFETITLYQNNIVEVKSTPLDNGKYQVDIEFNVSKYRNNEKGKRYYESDSLVYDTQKT
ncbi:MAG: M1 family aminopeptidase, partial [Flavobacteriales bacterium]